MPETDSSSSALAVGGRMLASRNLGFDGSEKLVGKLDHFVALGKGAKKEQGVVELDEGFRIPKLRSSECGQQALAGCGTTGPVAALHRFELLQLTIATLLQYSSFPDDFGESPVSVSRKENARRKRAVRARI